MGAPTETYQSCKVSCCKCSETRTVELHHPYEAYEQEDEVLGMPYGVRFNKMGWEFRVTEDVAGVGGDDRTYVEFVCPKCVAKEGEGKQVVKA